ncbi:MAG: hypothetical protein CMF25_07490 [Kangiellaceae bacterium]|jgi:uncharacterized BrkB/YihY/UPF0761 family membrane protein|nr:hypothetical protein [Kangiellaceae bacterium]|tara:strand:- start:2403 stop:2864 length:462 start_codon:yes stop_codon:yes gene_type:complete
MTKKSRKSSEIFADFTLSRVERHIRDSLSDEQYDAIRQALIAQDENSRHQVDVRMRLPFFFWSYYLVIFAGRDRRASTHQREQVRFSKVPLPIRRLGYVVSSFLLLAVVVGFLFYLAYKIKSLLGIDIFPNFHLNEFLPLGSFSDVKPFRLVE